MGRHLLFVVVLTSLLPIAPARAQTTNPQPPVATTSAATSITLTSATIPGTVDPNGAATTYHVEYGTTTTYGLRTPDRSAGAGTAPVAISVPLTGLTADTTYQFRVVATNAAGIGRSANRALRTARPPATLPPVVSTGVVTALAPRTATVTGGVNPRGLATRYRFEYGTGTSLNRVTPVVAAGAGTVAIAVSAPLTLLPNTRYSYRLVATNAVGAARGARRTFVTPRGAAMLTFGLAANRIPYEGTATLTGSATSGGTGDVPLVVQRQLFPFTGPFEQVGATRQSAHSGRYSIAISGLLLSARFRIVALTTPPVTSVARTVRTTVRVGLAATRRRVRRVRFSGEIRPGLTGGRVSLQRRKRGRFVTLRRVNVGAAGNDRTSYQVTIGARRTAAVYRVIVTPPASSGHVRGVSREMRVAGLRRH